MPVETEEKETGMCIVVEDFEVDKELEDAVKLEENGFVVVVDTGEVEEELEDAVKLEVSGFVVVEADIGGIAVEVGVDKGEVRR